MTSDENYFEDDISEGPNQEVDALMKSIKDMGDLYFVAQLVLAKLEPSNKNGMIAELSYLLDSQSFINLLWYFEGQTIRIPTRDELRQVLQMMSIYYYFEIMEKPWKEALQSTGIPCDRIEYKRMWSKYRKFMKSIESARLPKRLRRPTDDDKLREEGIDGQN